jgi:uncharacterized protein
MRGESHLSSLRWTYFSFITVAGCASSDMTMLNQFILKIASRCNLNCSYCYIYNRQDNTWIEKPPLMGDETFDAALSRIREYCLRTQQRRIFIIFHGGEPCLVGVNRFNRMCEKIRADLSGWLDVTLGIQTNGTLLDAAWADCFRRHAVEVGLSLDGPSFVHDKVRFDHSGRGTYAGVVSGLRFLQHAGINPGIMCVIPLGSSPLSVHHHFLELGCRTITYLLPHHTHEEIGFIRKRYGPTPCADFLIPIFDDWWNHSTMEVCIRDLENVARIILGGSSLIDTFGGGSAPYVFIETGGAIEHLDNLRSCANHLTDTGLNVHHTGFDLPHLSESRPITAELPRPCQGCSESTTCAGGYLPHRFSRARGFDNPSVWCHDILKLFEHVRIRLDVSVQETETRRSKTLAAMQNAAMPLNHRIEVR